MPSKVRALFSLGTLTTLAVVTTLNSLPNVSGQDKEAPSRKVEKQGEKKTEEKAAEKSEKKSEAPVPVKIAEPKREDRSKKTESPPVKGDEKTPQKTEGKAPMKEEGRVPRKTEGKEPIKDEGDAPRKVEGKVPEGRPVPRKGDPETPKDPVPGRVRPVPGKETKEPTDGNRPGTPIPKEEPKDPVPGRVRPVPGRETKEPGEGKRPIPGKEVPKGEDIGLVEGLPDDFSDQQRQVYRRIEDPELSFEEHLRFAKMEFVRLRHLEKNPASRYRPGGARPPRLNTACGSGGFEDNGTLNAAEWSGGHGGLTGTAINFAGFTGGLMQGQISDPNAHQTIVMPTAQDPFVGINVTGPNSQTNQQSAYAVRIGNAVSGAHAELLAKTFVVTPSDTMIRFWYAVVLQDPGHSANAQPSFEVRVIDNANPSVPNHSLVNLGGCANPLVANTTNPYFQTKAGPTRIVYKDWSCGQIDLSTMVGKTVTIEFVTKDCAAGGHWAYAYVDNICGTCKNSPTGDLQFASSTRCGKGNICFDYTLPHVQNAAGNVTGTADITLDLYQNGVKLTLTPPLVSPTLSSGTNYCFGIIDPVNIPGIDVSAGGFDFVATGTFKLGSNTQTVSVGTVPNGRVAGQNNDYKIACSDPPPVATGCCLGENLVKNGDFERPGEQFKSEYQLHQNLERPLVPGTFVVTDVKEIDKACRNWHLPKACDGTRDFTGNVLLVNGLTNQTAPSTAVIWEQKLELPSLAGMKDGEYRVCFRYLPLPQCCFDIQAKPSLVVIGENGPIPLTGVSDVDTGCGHLYSTTFQASGIIKLQIVLPGDGKGDGNDLLIDNISVAKLVNVPAALMAFTVVENPPTGSTFSATATAPLALTGGACRWEWVLWDDTNQQTIATTVLPNAPTATFSGLALETLYYVKLKVKCDCNLLTGSKRPVGHFADRSRRPQAKLIDDPNPEPLTTTRDSQSPAKRSE